MIQPNRALPAVSLAVAVAIGASACTPNDPPHVAEQNQTVSNDPAEWDVDFLQHSLDSDIAQVCSDADAGRPYPSTSLEITNRAKAQRFYAAYRPYAQERIIDKGLGWVYFKQGDKLPKQLINLDKFC